MLQVRCASISQAQLKIQLLSRLSPTEQTVGGIAIDAQSNDSHVFTGHAIVSLDSIPSLKSYETSPHGLEVNPAPTIAIKDH